jgi:hypothetical protein
MLARRFCSRVGGSKVENVATRLAVNEAKEQSSTLSIRRDNIPILPQSSESAEVVRNLSKVVLIRHGNSMFNKLFHELEGPGYIVTPRYFDIYSDLKIIDSPLSPKGIDQ